MEISEILVKEILDKVVADCMRRYQQKVNVGIQDSVSDLLVDFKEKMKTAIFEIAQSWTLSTKREKTLFPRDCRFLYTIGHSTIVVIEQMPGIRTLAMSEGILGTASTTRGGIRRVGLSLPYTVFILHFINSEMNGSGFEDFEGMYSTWRQAPLEKFTDDLYVPLLPNLHDNLQVCLGLNDIPTISKEMNIVEQSKNVIDHYWNSSFNDDLSSFWWSKSEVDRRLRTGNAWAQSSANDPLFILGVPLQKAKTLDELIALAINVHEKSTDFGDGDRLRNSLRTSIDKCATNLFSKISTYTREKNFEAFHPTEITKEMEKAIAEVTEQVTSIVFSLQIELNKAAEKNIGLQKDVAHYGWKPSGSYWE